MKRLSRTRLFLLEMLVNLLIFVIGAAVCITTLSEAYSLSASSRVLTKSHHAVENAVMAFRATKGNISELPDILNGKLTATDKMEVWYDKNWNVCSSENGIYHLEIAVSELENNIVKAHIVMYPPQGDAVVQLSISQYKSTN